ncbi:response regulator receiver protein [Oscillochloris trichoides DG-6]|uniref:Response regulator receiver protein n=1 Tax=Oscillochloris trichoides DG-6 TaxID=765420 RepID=E1IFX1_9CHLR|nr:response regulator [Oscillochloris trichoides]EFO79929.1 response regulator receiver protein [Oscillochloris trichoides DG-6]
MTDEVIILIAEDDAGHATLIQKNLRRAGLRNPILHFHNGQEVLDFLFRTGSGPQRDPGRSYLLVLDIRMPKVDGIEVLRRIKADPELRKLPVTMLTTTEDPNEIERCHMLGCSNYVTKPVDYNKFIEAIRQLGLFFTIVQVPSI